ncbi:hypothetical protein OG453_39375 [Streptomyces sp. NBC_01381]|uniref:hypothetical protein n=1 Tax=Streptomyces sp. NBC_01381 TaxID=2903845 RepID=UPI00225AB8E0|nr:hypothetical protein [Streptomyces sp. NBC_01381]MCX4672639.1 hypothetical protein [Streptomyces sp. NBC_01381]
MRRHRHRTRSLSRLAAEHESPQGNNERIRTTWFDPANAEALGKALDGLLADLKQPLRAEEHRLD